MYTLWSAARSRQGSVDARSAVLAVEDSATTDRTGLAMTTTDISDDDLATAIVRVSAENVYLLSQERDALRRQVVSLTMALHEAGLREEMWRTRLDVALGKVGQESKQFGMPGYWT